MSFGLRNLIGLSTACILALPGTAQETGSEGREKPDKQEQAKVGDPAPDFTLPDLKGKARSLSEYKGKVVVLEWVNKDCPVSRAKCPAMVKLSNELAEKDVIWLGIDSSHYAKVEDNAKYVQSMDIGYPVLMDTDGKVGRLYGARTTPHMYVINKEGTLVYNGAIDDDQRDPQRNYVREAVEALLAGKDVEVSRTRPYGCSVKYKR